ncbi:hypothetical protein HZH68_016046 [Vespula germanica]|uniref:Uncharacterized protein n=2 Tax=Vespula TaxID=7451 RepID=A0A834J334_VESGE|nr:hypothetical protein HZH66_014563 [Vespula vulgaris]KAF7381171.1 hypothetical protein HZH68_016046 [Vespula germanica]
MVMVVEEKKEDEEEDDDAKRSKYQQRNSYTGANPKPILNANELRSYILEVYMLTTLRQVIGLLSRNGTRNTPSHSVRRFLDEGPSTIDRADSPRNDKIFVLDDGPKRSPNN